MKYFISIVVSTLFILTGCNDRGEEEHMKLQSDNLIQAVENNDLEKVQEILQDSSYPINETNDKGETPLLIATHENYIEVAKLLIEAGADINLQDNIQDSAYLYAGAQGKTEILKYMIEHAEPNQNIVNRYGGNALIPAAEKGHLNNVKLLLLDGKADIDHQNNFGYTALIEAVALTDGSVLYQQIVQELLAHNANKELRDNSGKTALDYAKEMGYTKMIEMLED
ncbi:ankyrin repeat domain-containing protein [Lysinibacillus xylanilyticus]